MDHTQLDNYRQVIENILSEYASITYSYADIQSEVVFDKLCLNAFNSPVIAAGRGKR